MSYKDFPIRSISGYNIVSEAVGQNSLRIWEWAASTQNKEIARIEIDYGENSIPKNAYITKAELHTSASGYGSYNFGVSLPDVNGGSYADYSLSGNDYHNFDLQYLKNIMQLYNRADNNKNRFNVPPYIDMPGGWSPDGEVYYHPQSVPIDRHVRFEWEYNRSRVGPSFIITINFVRVYYEYNKPQNSRSLSPDKTTVNPRTPIKFTWDSGVEQEAYEFSYKVNSGSWVTKTVNSADRFYEMPAATITELSGTLDWRVRVKETSGTWSDYSLASVTLGALPQKPPILVYPVGDYVKNGSDIVLKWQFVSNTVEEQKKAEIKLKVGSGQWWDYNITTAQSLQANYLNSKLDPNFSGTVLWKVRTQNQFDEWSEWTDEAQFQIVGTPPIPTITSVSKTNKPLIKWTSTEQEAFTLRVLSEGKEFYNSGIVVGPNVRNYKLDEWLKTGTYTIELNVINKYDVKSPTATHTFDIAVDSTLQKPTIGILNTNLGVLVRSSSMTGEVYRDDVFIGNLKGGMFEDYTGTHDAKSMYFIRFIKDDNFVDSDKRQGITNLLGKSTLALVENPKDLLVLEYNLDANPKKKIDFEIETAKIPLNGKKYDFVEFGEGESEKITLNYLLEDMTAFIRLIKARKEVIYRDNSGFVFQGVISSFSYDLDVFGYLINFTIEKTGEKYEFKKN